MLSIVFPRKPSRPSEDTSLGPRIVMNSSKSTWPSPGRRKYQCELKCCWNWPAAPDEINITPLFFFPWPQWVKSWWHQRKLPHILKYHWEHKILAISVHLIPHIWSYFPVFPYLNAQPALTPHLNGHPSHLLYLLDTNTSQYTWQKYSFPPLFLPPVTHSLRHQALHLFHACACSTPLVNSISRPFSKTVVGRRPQGSLYLVRTTTYCGVAVRSPARTSHSLPHTSLPPQSTADDVYKCPWRLWPNIRKPLQDGIRVPLCPSLSFTPRLWTKCPASAKPQALYMLFPPPRMPSPLVYLMNTISFSKMELEYRALFSVFLTLIILARVVSPYTLTCVCHRTYQPVTQPPVCMPFPHLHCELCKVGDPVWNLFVHRPQWRALSTYLQNEWMIPLACFPFAQLCIFHLTLDESLVSDLP